MRNRNQNITLGYDNSDPFRQVSKLGFISLSATFAFTGSFSVDPNINFSNDTTQYHVRAINSHLILSSSVGSTIALSGTLKASGSGHTLTGTLTIAADTNPSVNLSSSAGQEYFIRVVGSDGTKRVSFLNRVNDHEINISSSTNIMRVMAGSPSVGVVDLGLVGKGHVILSSSIGSLIYVSGGLNLQDWGNLDVRYVSTGSVNALEASVAYTSVTMLTKSTGATVDFDFFAGTSYPNFVENTHWRHNTSPVNFTYTSASGRFTAQESGSYFINAAIYLESTTTATGTMYLTVNGTERWRAEPVVHSSVDPVERTISLILDLNPNDYVNVLGDSAGTLWVHKGSTMNITKARSTRYLWERSGSVLQPFSGAQLTSTNIGYAGGAYSSGTALFVTSSIHSSLFLMKGPGTPIGIAQNKLGGTNTMEFVTTDTTGNLSTRLMFRGGTDNADTEFYRGGSGSALLSMFIEGDTGYVGIGTALPQAPLHITSSGPVLRIDTSHNDAIQFSGVNNVPFTFVDLHGRGFRYYESSVGELIRITSSASPVQARVGINNAAPSDALDVTGDIRATGGFRCMVDGMWITQNVPATSKAVMGQPNSLANDHRVVMPYAGSIVGISAREYNGAAAAGAPITFSASINGTANATAIVSIGIGVVQNHATFAKDAVTFAAGDALGIFRATPAAWTSTTNDYNAWLVVEF